MSIQNEKSLQHDDHEGHGSTSLYVSVFIALCCLTSLSFLTYFDFWRNTVPVGFSRAFMLAVSCIKALLVITFFMHLKWEANWKWMLTVPASLMAIFLMAVLVPDIGLRMQHASYERMIYGAEVPADEDVAHDTDGHDDKAHSPSDKAEH